MRLSCKASCGVAFFTGFNAGRGGARARKKAASISTHDPPMALEFWPIIPTTYYFTNGVRFSRASSPAKKDELGRLKDERR